MSFSSAERLLGWIRHDPGAVSVTQVRGWVRRHGQVIRQAEQAECAALLQRLDPADGTGQALGGLQAQLAPASEPWRDRGAGAPDCLRLRQEQLVWIDHNLRWRDQWQECYISNSPAVLALSSDADWEMMVGGTYTAYYAAMIREHMRLYGTTEEQFAHVAVKNRHNAQFNPIAQKPMALSIDDVMASLPIAEPYKLLDCSLLSDGAAGIYRTWRR